MARITVEDCLDKVDNRFELVLAAAQRARQLSLGAEPRVSRENDKYTVIALREIADGHVTREVLHEDDFSVELETESAETAEASGEASGTEPPEVEGAPADEEPPTGS